MTNKSIILAGFISALFLETNIQASDIDMPNAPDIQDRPGSKRKRADDYEGAPNAKRQKVEENPLYVLPIDGSSPISKLPLEVLYEGVLPYLSKEERDAFSATSKEYNQWVRAFEKSKGIKFTISVRARRLETLHTISFVDRVDTLSFYDLTVYGAFIRGLTEVFSAFKGKMIHLSFFYLSDLESQKECNRVLTAYNLRNVTSLKLKDVGSHDYGFISLLMKALEDSRGLLIKDAFHRLHLLRLELSGTLVRDMSAFREALKGIPEKNHRRFIELMDSQYEQNAQIFSGFSGGFPGGNDIHNETVYQNLIPFVHKQQQLFSEFFTSLKPTLCELEVYIEEGDKEAFCKLSTLVVSQSQRYAKAYNALIKHLKVNTLQKLSITSLSSDDLMYNAIGDEEIRAVITSPIAAHLVDLELQNSYITDVGLHNVGDYIIANKNLKILSLLGSDYLANEGAAIIARAFPDSALIELDLSFCDISGEGFEAIAGILSNSPLERLFLGGNILELQGIEAIMEAAQKTTHLTMLDLTAGYFDMNDDRTNVEQFFQLVFKYAPKLSNFHLNLDNWPWNKERTAMGKALAKESQGLVF